MLGLRTASALLVLLLGCKSAEEKCETARVAAERSWGEYIAGLDAARLAAIAVQAQGKLSMAREVEPRTSAAAERVASDRFERGSDAWQRAYVIAQGTECAKDAQCAKLKHDDAVARDTQADLEAKLRAANLALAGVRKSAERARDTADTVTPDLQDPHVTAAKQSSLAVYEACAEVAP